MPGVMIIEALAQAAGILAFKTVGVVPDTETRFYFVAIDNARFRKPVEPGDQMLLKVTLKRAFKGIWKFHGSAEVDGAEVASAEIMVAPETKGSKAQGEKPREIRDDRSARGDIAASANCGGRADRAVYRHRRGRRHRRRHLDRPARGDQRPDAHRRRQQGVSVRLLGRCAAGQEIQRRTDAARNRRPQCISRIGHRESRHHPRSRA